MDVQSEIENSRQNEHVKMLSETELQQNYNRRENVQMIGLQEKMSTDENNRTTHESIDETIQRVIDLSHVREAKVNDKDISNAHRLPSRKPRARPINVRFA